MCEFDKLDKTFASDLYLIYKRSPSARVCISDKDQLLIYTIHESHQLYMNSSKWGKAEEKHVCQLNGINSYEKNPPTFYNFSF